MRRMRLGDWVAVLACLPVYVLLSSWFGLTRDWMFNGSGTFFGNAASFFGSVWQANVGADIVFTLGSAAVGFGALVAVAVSMRNLRAPFPGLIALGAGFASVLLNWFVYGISFMSMYHDWAVKNVGPDSSSPGPGLGDSLHFTWDWGWPSLVWITGVFPVAFWGMLSLLRIASKASGPGQGWIEPAPDTPQRSPRAAMAPLGKPTPPPWLMERPAGPVNKETSPSTTSASQPPTGGSTAPSAGRPGAKPTSKPRAKK